MKRNLLLLMALLTVRLAQAETWNLNSNGDWGVAANWSPIGVPSGIGDTALFGTVITADRTITQNLASVTLGVLLFNDDNNYTLVGNPITMFAAGDAVLAVNTSTNLGNHTIRNNLTLGSSVSLANPSSGRLSLEGVVSGFGDVTVSGGGLIRLAGAASNTHAGQFKVVDGIVELAKNSGQNAIAGPLLVSGTTARVSWINSNQLPNSLVVDVQNGGILDFNTLHETLGTLNIDSTGRLLDIGSLDINGGVNNSGTITLGAASTVSVGGTAVFNNSGQLNLAGGEISTSLGALNNRGLLKVTTGGTISGGGSWNNLGFAQLDSLLQVDASGLHDNSGHIEISAQGHMVLSPSAKMANDGTIHLAGGAIEGAAGLGNASVGALIAGHGNIDVPLSNPIGTLQAEGGTLRVQNAFSNGGVVRVVGGATLVSGTLTNTGLVTGDGSISNVRNNAGGRIEPAGLLVVGSVINSAGGLISAPSGSRLLLSAGLSNNNGLISPSGGTIDCNNSVMTNSGQISGFGTLLTGGLTNAGAITLVGGTSIVHGNLTNNAGKKIEVRFSDALFTGNVVNNGLFKTTAATTTFSGTYTENGVFSSDPANNYFHDVLISAQGAWIGGTGDRFFVSGDLISHSSNSSGWETRLAELHLVAGDGDKTLSINGADLGPSWLGYERNFAWGTLELAAGEQIRLLDGDKQPGGALYVGDLLLPGGLAQLETLVGNGLTIYYDPTHAANAYLHGGTFPLALGGEVRPVPEPATRRLMGVASVGLALIAARALRCRRSSARVAA